MYINIDMIDDSNRKWYEAKDIKKLLGITPGQLFHWGRTWGLIKPDIKAEGRQGKNKYSFKNILFLALIQELLNCGLDLKSIRKIIEIKRPFPHGGWKKIGKQFVKADPDEYNFYDIFDYAKKSNIYIFEFFRGNVPDEVKKGLYIPKDLDWVIFPIKNNDPIFYARSALIINLHHIITELEEMTGEEL